MSEPDYVYRGDFRMKRGKKKPKIYYTDAQRLEYGMACAKKWPHYFKMYCKDNKKDKDDPQTIITFFGYMKNCLTGKKGSLPSPGSPMEKLGFQNGGRIHQYRL